jgi:hypothetical protein
LALNPWLQLCHYLLCGKLSDLIDLSFKSRFHLLNDLLPAASTIVAFCFHRSRAARLKIVERETPFLSANWRSVGRSGLVSYSSRTSAHSC